MKSPPSTPPSLTPSPVALDDNIKGDNRGTVVIRSRPSIPSNARGVVCDSAIETHSHVVSGVRGEYVSPIHCHRNTFSCGIRSSV